jgi:uncharacterized protein
MSRKKNPRQTVLVVRLNDTDLSAVDLLVEAGLAQSRSEAASQLIAVGVQSSEDLLTRAKDLAKTVQSLKNEMLDAVKTKNADRVKQLLSEDSGLVHAKNEEGQTAVLLSAYYHANEVKDLLLERGPELNLYEAAAVGATERLRELLQSHPQLIGVHNPDGYTPLGLAAFFGNEETVRYLLDAGAEINQYSQDGKLNNTSLHASIAGNHEAIVSLLLSRGADVNAACRGSIRAGFTPLHVAVHFNRMAAAKLLLEHGANRRIGNTDGQTPAAYAELKGNHEMISLLQGEEH